MLNDTVKVILKLSIILLFFICTAITVSFITFIYTNDLTTFIQTQDFTAYITAGKMVTSGVKEQFYSPSEQFFLQHQIAPAIGNIHLLRPFLYPAFVAIPFIFFSLMPLQTSYIVWFAINTILLIFIFYTFATEFKIKDSFKRQLLFIILATYPPVIYVLTSGQITFFLLLALVMSRRALLRKNTFQAGLWLSLLAIKPQFLIVPFLFLLQKKEFKTLATLFCSCIVFVIISVILIGLRVNVQYIQFLYTILHWQASYTVDPQSIVTLRGLFQFILHTNNIQQILLYWVLAVTSFALLLLWFWRKQKNSYTLSSDWSMMILGMILISPYLSGQDLALLILPAMLMATKHSSILYFLSIGWMLSFLSQFVPLFIELQVLYLLLTFYLEIVISKEKISK